MTKTFINLTLALGMAVSVAYAQQADSKSSTAPSASAQVYKYKTKKLDKAEIDNLFAKPEKLVVIDLRRPDELTAIGGFPVYLSIQSKDLEKNLAFIPKDRTVVTVSNHAGRAGAAADLLVSKGFKVAGAIGVENYEAEGGKIVKITPPAPKVANVSGGSNP